MKRRAGLHHYILVRRYSTPALDGGRLEFLASASYHLELVVGTNKISLYVSDAYRRSLHPRGGSIRLDDGGELPLVWGRGRLVGPKPRGPRHEARCSAYLDDATVLSTSFVIGPSEPVIGEAGR